MFEFVTIAPQRTLGNIINFKHHDTIMQLDVGLKSISPAYSLANYTCMQEWWRYDDDAPWKAPGNRPGPTPFKDCERPFDIIPGGSSVERIKPDVVHTFHIGFGTDLGASFVVWLVRLGFFNNGMNHQSFDEKLKTAYSTFREYCHNTRRFTACDQWCLKKFSMASTTILKSSNVSYFVLFEL